ncbi:thymidylate synthase [Streptomyces sp. NPDC057654]|uniref:thymidylate synthase n=1 Tax=Streptomyces sp. NPDC057654 TaxID=3346196 RepID=UPI0036799D44
MLHLTPLSVPTLQDAYLAVIEQVAHRHEYINAPRGNASRECLNVGFTLADPTARVPYLASRKVNIVFHFAEALWYLWGRDDLEMMAYYAPQMRAYSADGKTMGGSAYGTRLFRAVSGAKRSAFDQVLDVLRNDPSTKRAVLTMFRPEELAIPDNPDVSCALALQFLLREGRLHAVCHMRANDADQGLLSDVFSFTLLQEFAARQLGVQLGTYTHLAGSMHIGDRDMPRVERVLAEAAGQTKGGSGFRFPAMPASTSWADLNAVQAHERALRTNEVQHTPTTVAETGLDPYWQQVLLLFEVRRQIEFCTADPVDTTLLAALDPGYRWLLAHRWPERIPTLLNDGSTL